jgi:hypothetical protein
MKRILIIFVLIITTYLALGALWNCILRRGLDNGEHMGYVLREGAEKLKRSNNTELVVEYQPMTGIQQEYYVKFNACSFVTVGGERGGSTTYHRRWVFVSDDLTVYKTNEATFITLRKNGERIDVVEVR